MVIKRSAFNMVNDMRAGKARYFQYTDGCAECNARETRAEQKAEPATCNACGITTYAEKPLQRSIRDANNRVATLPLFQALV